MRRNSAYATVTASERECADSLRYDTGATLILTNVKAHASALLGDFGIADGPLLALLTGKASPGGHLPFELPSSEEAVRQQRERPSA